jgi:hypothetical protein
VRERAVPAPEEEASRSGRERDQVRQTGAGVDMLTHDQFLEDFDGPVPTGAGGAGGV